MYLCKLRVNTHLYVFTDVHIYFSHDTGDLVIVEIVLSVFLLLPDLITCFYNRTKEQQRQLS